MENITTQVILNFLRFLNNTKKYIIDGYQKNVGNLTFSEVENDYFQANWEILVESNICIPGKEYLEVYGEGADCNIDSSRVCFADQVATHYVGCKDKSSSLVKNFYSEKLIDLSQYRFNSFGLSSDKVRDYDSIILEHLTEDAYANISLDNITFFKASIIKQ